MFQWSKDFLGFAASGATAAANYPLSRVADWFRPNRAWRSPDLGAQTIVCDLGAALSVAAIGIHFCNFSSVTFSYSTDNVTYTALPAQAIAQDGADGYWKLAYVLPAPVVARYWKVAIAAAGVSADGSGTWYIGCILFCSTWNAIADGSDPRTPFTLTLSRAYLRADIGGRQDVAPAGDRYLTLNVGAHDVPANIAASWRQIALLGEAVPFLLYWNRGSTFEAYLVRYTGDPRSDLNPLSTAIALTLRQVV